VDRIERVMGLALVGAVIAERIDIDAATVRRAEWVICSHVAAWFGRRALTAEHAYREAVAP
jgi:hypothetical protein